MKLRTLCVFAVMVFVSMALIAQNGQKPGQSSTNIDIQSQVMAGKQHGDNNIGGFSTATADSGAKASDPHFASGAAGSKGTVGGGDMQNDHKFSTGSSADAGSFGKATGQKKDVNAHSNVQQANWGVKALDNQNYTSGGSMSQVDAKGQETGKDGGDKNKCSTPKSFRVATDANANGYTTGTVVRTDTSSAAHLDTGADAAGRVKFSGNGDKDSLVNANGAAVGNVGSTLGGGKGDTFFGGAGAGGTTSFNDTGARKASGATDINANSKVTNQNGMINAESNVKATSTAGPGTGHGGGQEIP